MVEQTDLDLLNFSGATPMSLAPGTRLGVYEIQAPLGAGAMGEVFRARDTTLRRDVAVKVLPDLASADPERLARFDREAHLLAALNHPHIGSIYGVIEARGIRGLVLELVEGSTLAERIASGELSLEQALAIAQQIAEALEAAHDRGIVHRDLKPSNIKVVDDGTVKVLDFGLAKALDSPSPAQVDLMNSPTVSLHGTHVGTILGTVAYMSPEQAMGRPVDKHTDIWAFGVVLYEMLTGVRPFRGSGVPEVLAAIMKTDPDWNALPSATPSLVRRVLRRCLNRDPRQRLGDMRDARLDIADALTPAARTDEREHGLRGGRLLAMAAAAGICLAAALILLATGIVRLNDTSADPQLVRFTIPPPAEVIGTRTPSVSPDGRHLVFEAVTPGQPAMLWLQALDSLRPQQLSGTEGAAFPFWSPDSRSIGFFAEGTLKRIDITGGPPVPLCAAPQGQGGSWSSKGQIIFAAGANSSLQSIPDTGGTPVALTTLRTDDAAHWLPRFLPDGRHFLYFSRATGVEAGGTVYLASLGSEAGQPLVAADSEASFVAPDGLLYLRGSTLMYQPFDLQRRLTTGTPTPIAEGVGTRMYSASDTGVLVYAASPSEVRRRLVWIDRNRQVTPLNASPGLYVDPALSPDGRSVAVVLVDATGSHIWVHDLERGSWAKRTFEGINTYPSWSHDGEHILFTRDIDTLMRVASHGSGVAEEFLANESRQDWIIATSWSRDGALAFQRGRDVFLREPGGSVKPLVATPAFEREGRISPNGRWLAFRSDETGSDEVYVQSHPPGSMTVRTPISTGGGMQPMWAPNGRELFYKSGNRMMVVDVETGAAFKPGAPRVLFELPFVERPFANPARYAVSADAKRFLVTTTVPGDEATGGRSVPPFQVVLNWMPSLTSRDR
jgi:Tol biopolymer transport system component